MRRVMLLLAAIVVMLGGCAYTGKISSLPPVQDNESADMIVIRESALLMGAVSFVIQLDGIDIFAVANGSYTVFKVKAGEHVISANSVDFPTKTNESSVRISIEPGQRKYLYMSPAMRHVVVDRYVIVREVSREEGEKLMAKSKRQEE